MVTSCCFAGPTSLLHTPPCTHRLTQTGVVCILSTPQDLSSSILIIIPLQLDPTAFLIPTQGLHHDPEDRLHFGRFIGFIIQSEVCLRRVAADDEGFDSSFYDLWCKQEQFWICLILERHLRHFVSFWLCWMYIASICQRFIYLFKLRIAVSVPCQLA